jgi:predicted AAA+ superfamily ATPase
MATTNHERVGRALELLRKGLGSFIDRELESVYRARAHDEALRFMEHDKTLARRRPGEWDAAAQLKLMWAAWDSVFRRTLGSAERSLVNELRGYRNKWAHQESISSDDADRALDSAERLLVAVSAPEADEVRKIKMELRRLVFDEQMRGEKRKAASTPIESGRAGNFKPWREVVTPHRDVASGRYQQAEFAADLWQVHLGEGTDEYKDPVEFFRRTYLTESLTRLLTGAIQRLAGAGGDPVVQLQTNFGGGKTHSMLALYHLFSGANPRELAELAPVLETAGAQLPASVKRVVLVGNKISPGNPVKKPDGTTVRTLWGELAWQLGGKEAFARLKADDENATNPGDTLRLLFNEYGPCLILIDEWVAYARQLHEERDLPAGTFDTQFTFAQALTESAKLAEKCLVVVSLPASDTVEQAHAPADDVEVGGERGREALNRLRNVIGRIESSWRPATAEEGFEIVRRRLFEPLAGEAQFRDRDLVAQAFVEHYKSHREEFPSEARDSEYLKRIKAAYPVHPEIFDRLHTDWSTLVKFQRTRGVLRLMAAVIHNLWEKDDRNPLILPATIPIDDPRVQPELTRYLPDNWAPVIEKDVDGPNSLPLQLDRQLSSTLGKVSAARRVARTVYLGSAPMAGAAHRGIEDRRVKLGCVMPGESPSVFGDALRRLASEATYLYQDGNRYWYSTQATVTKMAEDRAEELKRDPDKVRAELVDRLRDDLRARGDFDRIHVAPQSGQDVPDDLDARLVVLAPDHAYAKEPGSPAQRAAQEILELRGNTPRLFRNTLVFLAADRTRLEELEDAARRYLAWDSIVDEKDTLDLSPHQVKQAENRRKEADQVVTSRLAETYQWLLVPVQPAAETSPEWQALKVMGHEPLAQRASRKLKSEELLIGSFAASRLRMELDRYLWRGGHHVPVQQLLEDFARYIYLPRLRGPDVLLRAISDGVASFTWMQDSFAYSESFDEAAGRYRNLQVGRQVMVTAEDRGVLVRSEAAQAQLEKEPTGPGAGPRPPTGPGPEAGPTPEPPPTRVLPKRFYGSVELDPLRVGRDASRIAEEVIAHLKGLAGADVKVTLEVAAEIRDGVPENVARIVTENSRTLKFTSHGFEEE